MKVVAADGFEFQFTDALDAFVFDEKIVQNLHFMALP